MYASPYIIISKAEAWLALRFQLCLAAEVFIGQSDGCKLLKNGCCYSLSRSFSLTASGVCSACTC